MTECRWLFRESPPALMTLWSAVNKSPNVWPNLQGTLVIFVRQQTSQFRSVGKWLKTLCIFNATFVGRSESESWEMCHLRDFVNSWTTLGGLASGFPLPSHCPSFFFVLSLFFGDRAGFPVPHRHLRTSVGLEDVHHEFGCSDVDDELAPEVAFDHWSTHMNNRVLRRVCRMTGRQACHRVFAPSRRDQDRERILVHPRFFAPLCCPLPQP